MSDPGGDRRTSFEEEALPHLDAVYRFALRLSGSQADAEDLAQDTFQRAYRSWDQYTRGTNCKGWLFTICRNAYLRSEERGRRHREILSTEGSSGPGDPSRDSTVFASVRDTDPEGHFFRSIIDAEVLAAIDELPEEYRTAIVSSDLEGMSYREVAELMDVPVGTVKSRLFRGRRALQERLYDYAVAQGYLTGAKATEADMGDDE